MIKISQSMIKAFNEHGYCPMKLKVCYVERTHQTIPTESMVKGQFFETLCIGAGVNGQQVTDLPRLKKGQKSTDQVRIEQQADEFKNVIAAHKIKIKETQLNLSFEWQPGIILDGTMDIIGSIWDDGPVDEAIIDLKLTADITSTFGKFSWRYPHKMDHTQVYMYRYIYRMVRGASIPFYYLVFDYKPESEYKIVKKLSGVLEQFQLEDMINRTLDKVNHHEQNGYHTVSNYENCKGCPLKHQCADASLIKKIQAV